jgi:hypothetical protein
LPRPHLGGSPISSDFYEKTVKVRNIVANSLINQMHARQIMDEGTDKGEFLRKGSPQVLALQNRKCVSQSVRMSVVESDCSGRKTEEAK